MKILAISAVAVSLFLSPAVQAARLHPQRINVPEMSAAPKLDGLMSEGEWASASLAPVMLNVDGRIVDSPTTFAVGQKDGTLYLLFRTEALLKVAVAQAKERDGQLWLDDAAEFHLNAGGTKLVLIANADGVFYDSRNGDARWNGPWQVATTRLGSEFAGTNRGFIIEAALPLKEAGLAPRPGERWQLQVALDMVNANPAAVWDASRAEFGPNGELVWGGAANRLESVQVAQGGRRITLTGVLGEAARAGVEIAGAKADPPQDLAAGKLDAQLNVRGGAEYQAGVSGASFQYSFANKSQIAVPIVAAAAPSKGAFYIACDMTETPAAERIAVRLELAQEGQICWSEQIDTQLTERYVKWLPFEQLKPGEHTLGIVAAKSGELLGQIPLRVPQKPAWADFKLPENLPKVPKPFVPVQADAHSARVWGREYRFGEGLFLEQVTSAGQEILAAPVTLRARLGSQSVQWKVSDWKLEEVAEDAATYSGVATAPGVRLELRTQVGFDGAVKFDWKLIPQGESVVLEDVALVVPVRRSVARSFMQADLENVVFTDYAKWNKSGDLTDAGWKCPFTYFFWLGDQQRGIQWFAESRLGWTPADLNKVVEVRCSKEAATLLLHIADGRRKFDKPIQFSFGLMASPIRPRISPDDWTANRIHVLSAPEQLTATITQRSAVDMPAPAATFSSQGCMELMFRLDGLKQTQDSVDEVLLCSRNDARGGKLVLSWIRSKGVLRITQQNGVVGEIPAKLAVGQWYRIAMNFLPGSADVLVDGKSLGKVALTAELPNNGTGYQWMNVAGSGRVSLRGWRISSRPRAAQELSGEFQADADTLHLERMTEDPTVLNVCNAEVGYLDMPAYLRGNWRYDAAERCLVAGADEPTMSAAEQLARMGTRAVIAFDWEPIGLGHGEPREPVFSQAVKLCNQFGMRFIPYTPDGINDSAPEFADHIPEMSPLPPGKVFEPMWRQNGTAFYSGCVAASQRQRNLWQIDKFMKLGCGGVYLDGQIYAGNSHPCPLRQPCGNPLHGHEVIDPLTGKPAGLVRIWDTRAYLVDMWRLISHYRPDAIMDTHDSAGFTLPTMAFATDASNFETVGVFSDWASHLDLPTVRTELYARQYGFNSDGLFYPNRPVPPEWGMALMGVHGMTPRAGQWGMDPARAQKLWQIADRFDTATAEWLPYFEPEKVAFHAAEPVLVSAFVHKGQRALVLMTNWSDQPTTAQIKVDWTALGLRPEAPIWLLNNNTQVKATGGAIQLPLAPRRLMYLWIGQGNGF